MENKKFLGNLAIILIFITVLLSIIPVIFYLIPESEKKELNVFTDRNGNPILFDQIKEGEHLLGVSKDGPTILIKKENKIYAFSAVCTHLGCIVKWLPEKEEFFCPCHAGRFDSEGKVIAGPPPAPLKRYKVEIDKEGKIILSYNEGDQK
ncbi:MAG: Rieske (2Fe-2S) protein [Candidatus Hydrothermales bacterium]